MRFGYRQRSGGTHVFGEHARLKRFGDLSGITQDQHAANGDIRLGKAVEPEGQ
jgi:hypothetical protein